MISVAMRDVLIEHVHGRPVREVAPSEAEPVDRPRLGRRMRVIKALLERRLLKPYVHRQRHFVITAQGREALDQALDDWRSAIERRRGEAATAGTKNEARRPGHGQRRGGAHIPDNEISGGRR